MRLLNAKTKKLEEFFDDEIPPYAILSHTWGKNEVLFKDIMKGRYNNDSDKIEGCCREALSDHLDYVWIDTCCIDKRSSAELSEAINSMFYWYENAAVCYAYLADVHDTMDVLYPECTMAFRRSKWWTRGWTLQELLAPDDVEFYNAAWASLGEKSQIADGSINGLIAEITGIRILYLDKSYKMHQACVAEKMSWAALRQTTRVEDKAYSLLGVFGVNMPLLYGEKERAFLRLQEAIISQSNDQSIFAWTSKQGGPSEVYRTCLLADSLSDFEGVANVIPYIPDWAGVSHYSMTNAGVQVSMRLRNIPGSNNAFLGLLNCTMIKDKGSRNIAITLTPSPRHNAKDVMAGPFIRCDKTSTMTSLSLFQEPDNDPAIPIYIESQSTREFQSGLTITLLFGIKVSEIYPPGWLDITYTGRFLDFSGNIPSRDINTEITGQQIIYLHCRIDTGESFVIRLHYGFRILRDSFRLAPLTLEFALAHLEDDISLAETMIMHDGQVDEALDWLPQLDLCDGTVTCHIEKEGNRGYRRLRWILHAEMISTRLIQVEQERPAITAEGRKSDETVQELP